MFHDADIQKWIEQHGVATSFTFMAYGKLSHDEVNLLVKGLIVQLEDFDDNKMAVFFDEVSEEQAVAWNIYRGTSITFVFAGDETLIEEIIKTIICDGLEYLRYKAEYISSHRSVSHV